MSKERIIAYIRDHDAFYNNAHLEICSYRELELMKTNIDSDKEIERSKNSGSDILSVGAKRIHPNKTQRVSA